MAISTIEARNFTATMRTSELSFNELLAMPYDRLYELHSAVTLRKRGSWASLPRFLGGEDELGFGNITVDKLPNKKGEAYMHVAPLPTTKVIDEFTYVPENPTEALKFALITAEDLLNLVNFYATLQVNNPEQVPLMLVGQTHPAMAEVAKSSGFSIRRQHEHNDIEDLSGYIRYGSCDV